METKHAQGVWEIRGNKLFVKGTFKTIALVCVQDNYEPITFIPKEDIEADANAKLIAAAPDLLLSAMFDACFPITTMEEESKTQEFAIKLGWKKDMPLENFAVIVRENAIKKAIE